MAMAIVQINRQLCSAEHIKENDFKTDVLIFIARRTTVISSTIS